jgi:hypothetical protein
MIYLQTLASIRLMNEENQCKRQSGKSSYIGPLRYRVEMGESITRRNQIHFDLILCLPVGLHCKVCVYLKNVLVG